jgi:hypothetical protein
VISDPHRTGDDRASIGILLGLDAVEAGGSFAEIGHAGLTGR